MTDRNLLRVLRDIAEERSEVLAQTPRPLRWWILRSIGWLFGWRGKI